MKLDYLNHERIGLQRGAAVDNWRRLISCIIPPHAFCFDTIILALPQKIDTYILLGLLNSNLWEWRFRCTSTTNHVNEYELSGLSIPPSLTDAPSALSVQIREMVVLVLSGNTDVRRAEFRNLPADAIDYRIDKLIYSAYGITDSEIAVVERGLTKG